MLHVSEVLETMLRSDPDWHVAEAASRTRSGSLVAALPLLILVCGSTTRRLLGNLGLVPCAILPPFHGVRATANLG